MGALHPLADLLGNLDELVTIQSRDEDHRAVEYVLVVLVFCRDGVGLDEQTQVLGATWTDHLREAQAAGC